MEKCGTQKKDLLEGLRNDEHNLTLEIMDMLKDNEKLASPEFKAKQDRLQDVRSKITEIDLGEKTG